MKRNYDLLNRIILIEKARESGKFSNDFLYKEQNKCLEMSGLI